MEWDLLLAGGTVVDGTGAAARRADVGVRDGRIAYVGPPLADTRAAESIDCTGFVVVPGFVDVHTHSDLTVLHNPSADSAVLQGVTTQVVGNCGFSPLPVPVAADRRDRLVDLMGGVGGDLAEITWTDLDGYARALADSPPTINVVVLVGHSALRIAATENPDGPANVDDVTAMRSLLRDLLAQGAAGLSTGLTLPPSALGDTAEIAALAAECAAAGRVYATHARATAGNEWGAIDEAIGIARATGVRLEYSHLALNNPVNWGRADESLRRFEIASAQGLPVGFDVYPYDASSSGAAQYLPLWVQRGGSAGLAANAADPAWRAAALAAIREGFFGGIAWQWDRIVLSAAPGAGDLVGLSFAQIADLQRKSGEEVLLDLCAEFGSTAHVVLHYRTEQDMQAFLAHPLSVVGSDGLARRRGPLPDHPHPRSFGTYPRVLGRYVRDLGLLDLPTAIRKMTEEPARRFGLADRGRIAQGCAADLVVLDPATVADRATFAQPWLAPVGVARTVVAGRTVQADGVVTASRPGRLLRCGG